MKRKYKNNLTIESEDSKEDVVYGQLIHLYILKK